MRDSDIKQSGDLLDTEAVAKFLNRSPGAIRNLVMRRAIPYRKPGGRLVSLSGMVETPRLQAKKRLYCRYATL